MTREEEIRQEAYRKYPYDGGIKGMICENSRPIFIQGAEWADKTMIEKVSKWLKEEFYTITNRNGYEDLVSASCDNVNELIEELKKVMEE